MASTTPLASQPRLFPEAVKHNARVISVARASLAAITGCAAGILGLTDLYGFAFYGLASIFMSLIMYVVLAKGNPLKYWPTSYGLWTDEVGANMVSYVLFWTMAYVVLEFF
ncbi:hypothetical protein SmJEL517_g04314 [Synchytrium microbalum]|uniref:ER membrane protein complex subunit 6 n=1 Tax=Synchytrium microbalum TaxID=1806994 RepID=A0A507C0R5_9FUNG|nr:uncharacterized protein SmJEL517_g04314 [Synchytrium microbalum]TPX32639.1 hypothetical protein SmJEL517_g04314 [Synchytrium microbalum]